MLAVMKWIKIEVTLKMSPKSNINAILSTEQIQFVVVAVKQPNAITMQNIVLNHQNVLTQKLPMVDSFVKIVAILVTNVTSFVTMVTNVMVRKLERLSAVRMVLGMVLCHLVKLSRLLPQPQQQLKQRRRQQEQPGLQLRPREPYQ